MQATRKTKLTWVKGGMILLLLALLALSLVVMPVLVSASFRVNR